MTTISLVTPVRAQLVDVLRQSPHRLQLRRVRASTASLIEAMDDGQIVEHLREYGVVVPQARAAVQDHHWHGGRRRTSGCGPQPNAVRCRKRHLEVAISTGPEKVRRAFSGLGFAVVPGRDMGDDETFHAGLLRVLTGVGRRQVQVGRVVRIVVRQGGFGQQYVGAAGELDQRVVRAGVAGVDKRLCCRAQP